ncbi:MAG: hypothetical protein IJC88_04585 [Oscillospiraceae bacterium]|nr:hypothetical protein [Oscillospiraceae bacterium]
MGETVCCVFGHRKIEVTEELRARVRCAVRRLVVDEGVDTILFGSKSRFDDLCHEVVSEERSAFPHLKRVYVRAEFPYLTKQYTEYLLESYEETYFPQGLERAGHAVYVERNFEMIRRSQFCLIYYDPLYSPRGRKSGTKIAYDYAKKQEREIINLFPKGGT